MIAWFTGGGPWEGREYTLGLWGGWVFPPLTEADVTAFGTPDLVRAAASLGIAHVYEPVGLDRLGRRIYCYRGYGLRPQATGQGAAPSAARRPNAPDASGTPCPRAGGRDVQDDATAAAMAAPR